MRYFSTFSGIGGFEVGIENASAGQHEVVGYSEIDKFAIKVYENHFKGVKNYGDITKINADELPDFDCLVGGFPCQAFSIAGKRKGFNDTRGTLFFDLARILRAKQPRLFVFENVKGLLSHDSGNTIKTIFATLDELGYDLQWQIINSKNHGVPQNRERVIIVGHLRGTPRPQVFPFRENDNSLTKKNGYQVSESAISGTLTATDAKMHLDGTYIRQLNQPTHSNDRVYGDDGISPALNTMQGGNRQPFVKVPEATKKGYAEASVGQAINLSVPNSKTRRGRVSDIAPTVDTGMQLHTLTEDVRIRRLTPMECERLQGFPDRHTEFGIDTTSFVSYNKYGKIVVCKTSKLKNTPNVRLKIATDSEKQILGIALCTTSGGNDTGQPLKSYDMITQGNRVSIAISRLENAEQTECVINITKCDDSTETHYTWKKSVANQDIADIFVIETDSQPIGELLKKVWAENWTHQRLSTTLTAIKQITDWITSILLTERTTLVSIELSPITSEKGTIFQIYSLTEQHIESISDSSRYKMCGNAVTTNVIRDVFERIFSSES